MYRYLQVSVHDAHGVQVVDCVQHLSNEPTGVHLGVETFLYDAVEQLASGHPDNIHRICQSLCLRHHTVFLILKAMIQNI